MFFNQVFNFIFIEKSKYFQIFGSILVRCIKPELVECIRSCSIRVEPYISRLGFSEFSSIGFSNQGDSKCKCFTTGFSPYEFGSCCNISPLVGAAHLKFAVVMLVKIKKIETLYEL